MNKIKEAQLGVKGYRLLHRVRVRLVEYVFEFAIELDQSTWDALECRLPLLECVQRADPDYKKSLNVCVWSGYVDTEEPNLNIIKDKIEEILNES